jgi:CubicO group peptidase (beta-lactamase class C family)
VKIHNSNLGPNFEKLVKDTIHTIQPIAESGVAIAVIKDGQVAFSGGFGLRDRATSAPVDAETCFALGSTTKAFTSMVVSIYAADNLIALDKPIKQYFPDFQMQDPQATAQMTLLDILSQSTGLAPHNALWYLGPFSRSELFYRLQYLAPVMIKGAPVFRTMYLYNNIMYMVAGYLLERLFGVSYEDAVKTRILTPLGMTSTSFTLAELRSGADYAKGYMKAEELALKDFTNIGPAAEINSNVLDMANWVQLFLSGGFTSNGKPIIGQAALQQMYTPMIPINDGTGDSYGLGWTIGTIGSGRQNKRLIFHTGDPLGGSTHVSFMPDDGLGVVVLTNQHCTPNLTSIWPDQLVTTIYNYLLNGQVTQLSAPRDLPPPASPVPVAPPAALGAYTGMFSNPGYGNLVVSIFGTGLNISYYDKTWPLQPLSATDFQFVVHAFGAVFPVRVIFTQGSAGTMDQLAASMVLQPVIFVPFARR